MGWQHSDRPGHEGHIVAVALEGSLWRELRYPHDSEPRGAVSTIQVGCDCGWRSPRMTAPKGAHWQPFAVGGLSDGDRSRLAELWERHMREPDPSPSLRLVNP
jgi:hypothetical protein